MRAGAVGSGPRARAALGLCAAVVGLACACDGGPNTPPPGRGRARAAPAAPPPPEDVAVDARGCARGVPALPAGAHRGLCFAHSWEGGGEAGYGSPASAASLAEARALGVDWISVTPFGFMRRPDADRVHLPRMEGAETDARVRAVVEQARAAGLRVLYKPHVWVGGGAWIGAIDPGDDAAWDRWWASHRGFVLHHARLAAELEVPILSVGCELKSTSVRFEARWRALVEEVRAVYPGELTYAANWDEVVDVRWWDALDYVGIQFYPQVAASRRTTEAAKRARLAAYVARLEAHHRETGKPVLFTEVGYRARLHPEIHPHAWPEHDGADAPPPSEAAQALAYARFFQAIEARPWVAGVYWWKWFSNPASVEEGPDGFSPRGKQAAHVLRAAYHPDCRAPHRAGGAAVAPPPDAP